MQPPSIRNTCARAHNVCTHVGACAIEGSANLCRVQARAISVTLSQLHTHRVLAQVLHLAGNRIGSLAGLAALSRLELIDLKFNYIERTSDVRLLSLNRDLRTLALQGNPVTKIASYRATVIATLPALLVLDGQRTPRSSVCLSVSTSIGIRA